MYIELLYVSWVAMKQNILCPQPSEVQLYMQKRLEMIWNQYHNNPMCVVGITFQSLSIFYQWLSKVNESTAYLYNLVQSQI